VARGHQHHSSQLVSLEQSHSCLSAARMTDDDGVLIATQRFANELVPDVLASVHWVRHILGTSMHESANTNSQGGRLKQLGSRSSPQCEVANTSSTAS